MNVTDCRVFRHEMPLPPYGFRDRIIDWVQYVENLAHTRVDVPALQFCARRVDREPLPFEFRKVEVAADLFRRLGNPLELLASNDLLSWSIEDQECGMRQLQ